MRHFNERLAIRYQLKLYPLGYETWPDLHGFLDNPSPAKAASNIDFFHITDESSWDPKGRLPVGIGVAMFPHGSLFSQ
jgi:hypothetical protein